MPPAVDNGMTTAVASSDAPEAPRYEQVRCEADIHKLKPYPRVQEWSALRAHIGLDPDPPPHVAPSYPEAVEWGSELFDAGREGICGTCRWSQHYYTNAGEDHAALACFGCAGAKRRERKDAAEKAEREALKAAGKVKFIFRQGWVEPDPPEWLEYAKAEAAKARAKWEAEEQAAASTSERSEQEGTNDTDA